MADQQIGDIVVEYARTGIARCGDRLVHFDEFEDFYRQRTDIGICRQLIYDLLPQGLAWNRDPDSDMWKFVSSMSVEAARINDRMEDLLIEIDPFQTEELLTDFESAYGLPDECIGELEQTVEERRAAVVAAIAKVGGSTIEYFEQLLLTLGYDVEIIDFDSARTGYARCGDRIYGIPQGARVGTGGARCGDRIYNPGWTFYFQVIADNLEISYARTGTARCGDRLADFGDTALFKVARTGTARCGDRLTEFGNAKLECVIREYKPAHTAAIFSYGSLNEV